MEDPEDVLKVCLQHVKPAWYITYQGPKLSPVGTPKYTCDQLVCSIDDFLVLLRKQNTYPYTEFVSVIHPTTIHSKKCIMREMLRGAEIVMYVGYVDFDAFPPVGKTPLEFKQSLCESFVAGLTLAELCVKHREIAECMLAAALLCKKLKQMGHSAKCWWTGRKGFRVVWTDLPGCFLRCKAGERRVAINIVQVFFKEYIGRELHERIEALAFFDFIVYTQHNMQTTGIKPDLAPHYSTGLYAFFLDMEDLLRLADKDDEQMPDSGENGEVLFPYKTIPLNGLVRSEALCTFVIDFWTFIFTNIPDPGRANVLSFTPKPPKRTREYPVDYHHKPPWERRVFLCNSAHQVEERP